MPSLEQTGALCTAVGAPRCQHDCSACRCLNTDSSWQDSEHFLGNGRTDDACRKPRGPAGEGELPAARLPTRGMCVNLTQEASPARRNSIFAYKQSGS